MTSIRGYEHTSIRGGVIIFLGLLLTGSQLHGQTREAARFMDVFPGATVGASVGAVLGYQVGVKSGAANREYVALAAALVTGMLGSAAGAWIAERDDDTEISLVDAVNSAAATTIPAVLLAAAVTWQLPKSLRPWIGTITFSVLQGTGTAVMAARHSRHRIDDAD